MKQNSSKSNKQNWSINKHEINQKYAINSSRIISSFFFFPHHYFQNSRTKWAKIWYSPLFVHLLKLTTKWYVHIHNMRTFIPRSLNPKVISSHIPGKATSYHLVHISIESRAPDEEQCLFNFSMIWNIQM